MANDKNYFDILEHLSRKLQNHVSDILKILSFNADNSDKSLLNAINYYNKMDRISIPTFPLMLVKKSYSKNNAVNWFFSIKTLTAANERIREYINRLALPHIFSRAENQRHGSSDVRKVGVSVDCLLATYSFRYFGKDKGVSIYTFIDDRQVLLHHNVMSSSEREVAYVIDGFNNMNVAKMDIHSTDTHSYTELIFSAMHFLGISFAPRINFFTTNIFNLQCRSCTNKIGSCKYSFCKTMCICRMNSAFYNVIL